MPTTRSPMSGTPGVNDCEGSQGCGVSATGSTNSYGPPFNNNGGGWYAMERTDAFIRVFFWSRGDTSVPSEVSSGASTINTDSWVSIACFYII